MINPNELRTGDWLFELEYIQVKSISEHGINADEKGAVFPFDCLTGIPLTPEILEKCGFEKEHGMPWYEIDMKRNIGQIHINPDNGMVWLRHHRNPETGLNPMTGNPYYLHQLQNLYFALTGEELEVTL